VFRFAPGEGFFSSFSKNKVLKIVLLPVKLTKNTIKEKHRSKMKKEKLLNNLEYQVDFDELGFGVKRFD